jgi:hypothetical protein
VQGFIRVGFEMAASDASAPVALGECGGGMGYMTRRCGAGAPHVPPPHAAAICAGRCVGSLRTGWRESWMLQKMRANLLIRVLLVLCFAALLRSGFCYRNVFVIGRFDLFLAGCGIQIVLDSKRFNDRARADLYKKARSRSSVNVADSSQDHLLKMVRGCFSAKPDVQQIYRPELATHQDCDSNDWDNNQDCRYEIKRRAFLCPSTRITTLAASECA